jgi:hypothetical protein
VSEEPVALGAADLFLSGADVDPARQEARAT